MSRIRGSTVLATIVAMLVMAVGAVTLTPSVASASHKKHYPPPPPALIVDRGVVKYGTTVRAIGRQYGSRERVYVTVSYRPNDSRHWRTVKTTVVWTNRNGSFSIGIRLYSPGLVTITARGGNSRQSASAFVYVIDRRSGHGGGWSIRPASNTTPMSGTPATPESNAPGLAAAGLGVLALAGSLLLTRRTIRRRRGATPAA